MRRKVSRGWNHVNSPCGLGTVAPGKLADLVLLDADPLADISNTMRIAAVIANGRLYDRAALDVLLADGEKRAKAPPPGGP